MWNRVIVEKIWELTVSIRVLGRRPNEGPKIAKFGIEV